VLLYGPTGIGKSVPAVSLIVSDPRGLRILSPPVAERSRLRTSPSSISSPTTRTRLRCSDHLGNRWRSAAQGQRRHVPGRWPFGLCLHVLPPGGSGPVCSGGRQSSGSSPAEVLTFCAAADRRVHMLATER